LNGKLIETNDAINIAEAGNYKVTIDFSQSDSPYAYTYTVVKSGDVAAPARLWLPGGYQGWSPATAPTIYAINDAVYEGYIFIPEGTGFKFTNAPDWDHINYGDSGTPGVLTTDGLANGLSINTSGYYKLTANVVELTYDIRLVNSWGMIGTATPGAWDNSSPLTYDMANDVWKATINLVPGALKFRANNNWDLNYGPAVIADLNGTLIQTNDAINITEAGSYTVTLDFSRSEAPYKYTYTVVKN
jgi:starch-binding outer membrane protein SusE/F